MGFNSAFKGLKIPENEKKCSAKDTSALYPGFV